LSPGISDGRYGDAYAALGRTCRSFILNTGEDPLGASTAAPGDKDASIWKITLVYRVLVRLTDFRYAAENTQDVAGTSIKSLKFIIIGGSCIPSSSIFKLRKGIPKFKNTPH
jgi:hypothetical protein